MIINQPTEGKIAAWCVIAAGQLSKEFAIEYDATNRCEFVRVASDKCYRVRVRRQWT